MNSKTDISLLYDFYGELLKTSQQQVVELYVNEDLSLSEVSGILSSTIVPKAPHTLHRPIHFGLSDPHS